jgi:DNA-binding Lrp family transcriptional regulator
MNEREFKRKRSSTSEMKHMKEPLKNVELRLISELMKNSRRSDRELAKAIGVSQPTVTRTRVRLEKEGYIKEYTMIPDFGKLGYGLMSVTFINAKRGTPEENNQVRDAAAKEVNKKVFPDLLIEQGLGHGYSGVIITLHRKYSDYAEQLRYTKSRPFVQSDNVWNFLVNLEDKVHFRSLTLSLVADDLIKVMKEKARSLS